MDDETLRKTEKQLRALAAVGNITAGRLTTRLKHLRALQNLRQQRDARKGGDAA